MNDMDRLVFRDILEKIVYYKRLTTKGCFSGRDRYIKNDLDKEVRTISNLDTKLYGYGIERIIITSNLIDIYTRLEVLLGLQLSGHGDTLTEASSLIDELYKTGEIQNKQLYQNAPNKFSTLQLESSSKILEQIAFNTRPGIKEHMLIAMDKSTHEEHLSQPLQTNNKQF